MAGREEETDRGSKQVKERERDEGNDSGRDRLTRSTVVSKV